MPTATARAHRNSAVARARRISAAARAAELGTYRNLLASAINVACPYCHAAAQRTCADGCEHAITRRPETWVPPFARR